MLRARLPSTLDVERQLAVFGLVPERPPDGLEQARRQDFLGVHRHRAGLDLGQVEDVADQVEQVGAGAVDGAGEFHLLRRQIAVRIFGELLAEDQDAVQRRAQLVRHVGQEFRLVFRGQRKLGRLLFQRAARLLDFLVLALDFDVALGELLGLLFELLVGLLQFLLLGLKLAGELLRLLQQAFGLHRRLDAVEHDADAVGQLFEEGDLRGGEGGDRGQLDHGLDLVFEQDRKHDQILRQHPHQRGIDRHRVDSECPTPAAGACPARTGRSAPRRTARIAGADWCRRRRRPTAAAIAGCPRSRPGRSRPYGR